MAQDPSQPNLRQVHLIQGELLALLDLGNTCQRNLDPLPDQACAMNAAYRPRRPAALRDKGLAWVRPAFSSA
jgi:hypothetical protein